MITLSITDEVLVDFPSVHLTAFTASGVDSDKLRSVIPTTEEVCSALADTGITIENLASHPTIEPWRRATQRVALKPSRYKSSVEALARRFIKNQGVSTPIPMVDLYCAVSAMHLAPLGAYDPDRISLPAEVELRHPRSADQFRPLGGSVDDMPLAPGVVVYAIGNSVACWNWNHRDSKDTSLTPSSTTALIIGEAITTEISAAHRSAISDLRNRLKNAGCILGDAVGVDALDPVTKVPLA